MFSLSMRYNTHISMIIARSIEKVNNQKKSKSIRNMVLDIIKNNPDLINWILDIL